MARSKREAKGIRHGAPRVRVPEDGAPEPETRAEEEALRIAQGAHYALSGGPHDCAAERCAMNEPTDPAPNGVPAPKPTTIDGPTRDTHPHLFWPMALPPGARERLVSQLGPDGVSASGRPVKWVASRPTYPCPQCDRILTDPPSPSQAVVCLSSSGGMAWMSCRVCQHRWKMPRV